MKKQTKIILIISIVLTIVLTAVSAVCSYVAMINDFDHDIFHFESGSIFAAIGMYLPILASVAALVCALLIREKTSFHEMPKVNIPTIFSSVFAGLLMVISAVMSFVSADELSKLSVAVAIFSAISGLYLILLAFTKNTQYTTVLSFAPAIWAALKLLEEYFRTGEPINSPIRTVNLTMYAFILLFFAEEVRFFIGRQMAGVYYFCLLSAIAFTGNAVFPKLAMILFSGNKGFDFSFIEWCLGFALLLFLLSRLSAAPAALGEYIEPQKKSKRSK